MWLDWLTLLTGKVSIMTKLTNPFYRRFATGWFGAQKHSSLCLGRFANWRPITWSLPINSASGRFSNTCFTCAMSCVARKARSPRCWRESSSSMSARWATIGRCLRKKNSQAQSRAIAGCSFRCRLPPPDRRVGAADLSRLLHVDVCLWLRMTEAITLPITAVDSRQMVLRVIGKGNKERALPLTETLLAMLRQIWKTHKSPTWLFPSRRILTHLPEGSARDGVQESPGRLWLR